MPTRRSLFLGSLLLASLIAAPVASAADDVEKMLRDAIALHDQGKYDEAAELFKHILNIEPANVLAQYELAFTYQMAGDMAACIETADGALQLQLENQPSQRALPELYVVLGSCHSSSGDAATALDVFRAGLAEYPDNYGLLINIAITLANTGNNSEAARHLEDAIMADSSQPSPFYLAGLAYKRQGKNVRSILAHISFLHREFNTDRCKSAAGSIFNTSFAQIVKDKEDQWIIGVSLHTDENSPDMTSLSMALGLLALTAAPDGKVEEPVLGSITSLLQQFVSMAAAFESDTHPASVEQSHLLADVRSLEEHGVTAAFSYYVASVAGVDGAKDWLDANAPQTDALVEYLKRP